MRWLRTFSLAVPHAVVGFVRVRVARFLGVIAGGAEAVIGIEVVAGPILDLLYCRGEAIGVGQLGLDKADFGRINRTILAARRVGGPRR